MLYNLVFMDFIYWQASGFINIFMLAQQIGIIYKLMSIDKQEETKDKLNLVLETNRDLIDFLDA